MNKSLNKKYIFFKKIMTPFDIDEKHMEYSFLNKNKNIFKSIFNMQRICTIRCINSISTFIVGIIIILSFVINIFLR